MVAEATTDTSVLTELCAMCAQVLQQPEVTPADDLFDLDPDSLTLLKLNSRIQDRWGVAVSVDMFYDIDSVGALADLIVAMRDA